MLNRNFRSVKNIYLGNTIHTTGGMVYKPILLINDPVDPLAAVNKYYVYRNISLHKLNNNLHVTDSEKTILNKLSNYTTEINLLKGLDVNLNIELDKKISIINGTVDGELLYKEEAITDADLVNKATADLYIDAFNDKVHCIGEFKLMDDRYQSVENFLECNGDFVDKNLYKELYDVIGDSQSLEKTINLNYTNPFGGK